MRALRRPAGERDRPHLGRDHRDILAVEPAGYGHRLRIGEARLVAVGQRQPGEQRHPVARRRDGRDIMGAPVEARAQIGQGDHALDRPLGAKPDRQGGLGRERRRDGFGERGFAEAGAAQRLDALGRLQHDPVAGGADHRFLLAHRSGGFRGPAQMDPPPEQRVEQGPGRQELGVAILLDHLAEALDDRALRDDPARDALEAQLALARRQRYAAGLADHGEAVQPLQLHRAGAVGRAIDRHRHLVGGGRGHDRLRCGRRRSAGEDQGEEGAGAQRSLPARSACRRSRPRLRCRSPAPALATGPGRRSAARTSCSRRRCACRPRGRPGRPRP